MPGSPHYYLAVGHGLVQAALNALDDAGIEHSFRKGPTRDEELPSGGEIDLLLRASDVGRARAALATAGFHHLEARGHPHHHFWLGFAEGRWLKVDVKTKEGAGTSGPGRSRLLTRISRRRPAGRRRLGPVVALLGPDGAGKGSVVGELQSRIPIALTVAYMGAPRSGNQRRQTNPNPSPGVAREVAFIGRRLLRAWARLVRAYAAAWRGNIVIFDRHPIEVLAVRPPRSRLGTRIERVLFDRLLPRPDRIVILDAPADVLFARKQEHSAEKLERWRRAYVEEFVPRGAALVSSAGPIDETVGAVSTIVWEQLSIRRRW